MTTSVDRRKFLAGATVAGSGFVVAKSGLPVADNRARTVNVMDFGARGDGITDDTAAFNRATQADKPWQAELEYAVLVPSGHYRIDGSVFVRKGQSLLGEGHASYIDARKARSSTFILGNQRNHQRGDEDPGGAPVRISGLRTLGGSSKHGLIYTRVAGFSINSLFMTACGIGLEIEGNDGIISDIYIDQCLNGVVLRRASR